MWTRGALAVVLALGTLACDSVLPPRDAAGLLTVRVGQRRFFGPLQQPEIARGDAIELELAECIFELERTREDSSGAAYDLRLVRPCDARTREALPDEDGEIPDFIDYIEAQHPDRFGGTPFAERFPPRPVHLETVEGELLLLYDSGPSTLIARGPCSEPRYCTGQEELTLDVHLSVE